MVVVEHPGQGLHAQDSSACELVPRNSPIEDLCKPQEYKLWYRISSCIEYLLLNVRGRSTHCPVRRIAVWFDKCDVNEESTSAEIGF